MNMLVSFLSSWTCSFNNMVQNIKVMEIPKNVLSKPVVASSPGLPLLSPTIMREEKFFNARKKVGEGRGRPGDEAKPVAL